MKKSKYMAGGDIDEAGLGQYEKKVRKPLPSETIKENTKAKETNEKVKSAIIGGVTGLPGMAAEAGKRIYQNVMGTPEQNRLVVEITEKRAAKNHRELIERIATHIKHNKVTK